MWFQKHFLKCYWNVSDDYTNKFKIKAHNKIKSPTKDHTINNYKNIRIRYETRLQQLW